MAVKRQDVCDGVVAAMPVKTYTENSVNQKHAEIDTFVVVKKSDVIDAVEVDAKEIYKRTLGDQSK